ncbi:MAG TPA: isochorismatase family protein, partial [Nitrospira sp.]|nr:isochorismatase family protein [Nitrospira sp.]
TESCPRSTDRQTAGLPSNPLIALAPHDALLLVDIQNDFLPGGRLETSDGDAIIPILLDYVRLFQTHSLPIFLTRDWHPPDHCSFKPRRGPWPVHCVAGSPGSLPPPSFPTPVSAVIIYKAIDRDQEAYSAFQHTALDRHLRALTVHRLFIGGLATDYCVLNSVKDARMRGYDVCLLMDGIMDGIKAVNLQPDDGRHAEEEMVRLGAAPVRWEMLKI